MNKKSNPQATKTKHERDLATFERLPEETKALMRLKEHHEKTSGHDHSAVTEHIEETSASYDNK